MVTKIPSKASQGEEMLAVQLRCLNIPFRREYQFRDDRKWRFDFVLANKIAIEVEGICPPGKKSRHTSVEGFNRDCEKYNAAAIDGWLLLRFSQMQVKAGFCIDTILQAIETKEPNQPR